VRAAATSAPEAEFLEPDVVVYPALIPSDPEYPNQWHHPVLRTPEAWEVTTGSPSVVVAVIDSGLDLDHPDMAPNVWTNPGEIPGNGKDDDGNGYLDDVHGWDFYSGANDPSPKPDGKDHDGNGSPDDEVNHGTLVAGLIGAALNNWGAVGVCPRVTIMPLKVFPADGGTTMDILVPAVMYALAMHAAVINLSLGVDFYVESFDPVIEAAHQAGVTVVVAGGNSGLELTDDPSTQQSPVCNDGPNPATDNWVLGCGATDRNDRKCSFSNYDGSTHHHFIDVCAPGQGVYGPGYQDPTWPKFAPFFITDSGTSFSSPIVAGIAALLQSQTPGISTAEIVQRIRQSADNIDPANPGFVGKLGAGRANAGRALGLDLPPAAVQNVRAADTPGDDGGSITVRWIRSTDDGGGAQDVTGYTVRRSRAASGPFTTHGALPAGTEVYVDAPVPNGVPFYYVVVARDAGKHTSTAAVAGPATAADDLAPPAVTGVTAADVPHDSGGAIRVSWSPYAAPADFAAFRIYRATTACTTVMGLTPIGAVTDASATSYPDATALDGVDYWYAVTAVDHVPNERPDVTACGPVQSFPNRGFPLPAGLNFLATAVLSANRDPAALFGIAPKDLIYARWDPSAQSGQGAYLFYNMAPDSPYLALDFARGFWVVIPSARTIDPEGQVAPSGPFSVALEPGWRQLGNPFLSRLDFTQSTVTKDSVTMDLASAQAMGIMKRTAWVFNPTTRDYEIIDAVVGEQPRLVSPWQGFWVQVLQSCQLALSGRVSAAKATEAAKAVRTTALPKPVWQAQIMARAGDSVDAANYFGVAPDPQALAVEAPPVFGNGVDLSFSPSVGAPARLAAAFSAPSGKGEEWRFTVRAPAAGEVELTTPDLSRLPSDRSLLLTDVEAGRSVALRTTPTYRYRARAEGEVRHFRLAVQGGRAQVVVSALLATPTRGGGLEVRFSLTAAAACDVTITNIAGRPVRQLERAQVHAAGQQVLLWDGRNDSGLAVPGGRYLIRVKASSSDGATAQALSAASIQR
jgi:subtilisin family serine protease